jgi:hypothetical protein
MEACTQHAHSPVGSQRGRCSTGTKGAECRAYFLEQLHQQRHALVPHLDAHGCLQVDGCIAVVSDSLQASTTLNQVKTDGGRQHSQVVVLTQNPRMVAITSSDMTPA